MNRTGGGKSNAGRRGIDLIVRAMLGVALAAAPLAVHAGDPEPYPSRPIHLVVPFTAGNQLDVFARLIGARLSESLGQPVLVENRQGVAGNAASEAVAKAAPDGYTLLVSGVLVTLLPLTYGSRAVDPIVSFAPVTRIAQSPLVIAVNPALNVNSLAELIALARAKPGKLAYATSGIGTLQHITMTMLSDRAGVEFLHVPYANTGQMVADVLSGQVPIVVSLPVTIGPHVKAGRLKALAVTSAHRSLAWPDTPTVSDAGFPGFEAISWTGVLAPAGTSPEIIDRLRNEIVRILATPDVRNVFLSENSEPVGNTPEQFAAEIKASVARWAPVVKAAGIHVD